MAGPGVSPGVFLRSLYRPETALDQGLPPAVPSPIPPPSGDLAGSAYHWPAERNEIVRAFGSKGETVGPSLGTRRLRRLDPSLGGADLPVCQTTPGWLASSPA